MIQTRSAEVTGLRGPTRLAVVWACILVGVIGSGCSQSEGGAVSADLSASAIDNQECAVCGMLVADQPAPRGQAVHRDGTTAFTCSLGDLQLLLSAPSPHGRAAHAWVEVMKPTQSTDERATHAHRWLPADEAWYVVGVERRGIMGPPVLAYATKGDAEAAAHLHVGARVVDQAGLEEWWNTIQQ